MENRECVEKENNMKPITAVVKEKGGATTYPSNQEVTLNSDGSGGPIFKRFKSHKMYGKKGEVEVAETNKEHLALKNKGYDHSAPSKQTARSKRIYARSEKNAARGRKAVDEGRDRKADRLLKRAARQEDKAIRIEEKENNDSIKSPVQKKDACYTKVASRYKGGNSAYRSGAMVKCRKVGAANWGNKSK